jgi:hypothetical protein
MLDVRPVCCRRRPADPPCGGDRRVTGRIDADAGLAAAGLLGLNRPASRPKAQNHAKKQGVLIELGDAILNNAGISRRQDGPPPCPAAAASPAIPFT